MGLDPMNRPGAFAKTVLLFFALLFIGVLIHPDVDLLDVHDVKITNVRTQIRAAEGQLISQAPFAFAGPQIDQPSLLDILSSVDVTGSSRGHGSVGILRI